MIPRIFEEGQSVCPHMQYWTIVIKLLYDIKFNKYNNEFVYQLFTNNFVADVLHVLPHEIDCEYVGERYGLVVWDLFPTLIN